MGLITPDGPSLPMVSSQLLHFGTNWELPIPRFCGINWCGSHPTYQNVALSHGLLFKIGFLLQIGLYVLALTTLLSVVFARGMRVMITSSLIAHSHNRFGIPFYANSMLLGSLDHGLIGSPFSLLSKAPLSKLSSLNWFLQLLFTMCG